MNWYRKAGKLKRLSYFYQAADVKIKQKLLTFVLPGKSVITPNGWQTPYISPIFEDKVKAISGLNVVPFASYKPPIPLSISEGGKEGGLQTLLNLCKLLKTA